MNKENISVNIAIAILVLAAVALVWFKYYVSTPHYFTYVSNDEAYTLAMPADWSGFYEVEAAADGSRTSFMFQSVQEPASLLFMINKTTILNWENLRQDKLITPVSRELARVGEDVYFAQWLANNPYQKYEARRYLDMVRDFSVIFDSFQLKPKAMVAEAEYCIQVITQAFNPATGEIKDFPTPCDVPDSWEISKP